MSEEATPTVRNVDDLAAAVDTLADMVPTEPPPAMDIEAEEDAEFQLAVRNAILHSLENPHFRAAIIEALAKKG